MNIQEMIKEYKEMTPDVVYVEDLLEDLHKLKDTYTPEVPEYVADWYEKHKDDIEFNIWDWIAFRDEPIKVENEKFNDWLNKGVSNPTQTLVKMHLFGYKVKDEKKYTVKITKTAQYLYCVDNDFTFVNYVRPDDNPRIYHTNEELEKAGFGEVFNSPLFEIEEVEE